MAASRGNRRFGDSNAAFPTACKHPDLLPFIELPRVAQTGREYTMPGPQCWQEENPENHATSGQTLTLRLPVRKPDLAVPVVEMMLKQ
jgi:hypothetical protein